jgi:hypothetical protein
MDHYQTMYDLLRKGRRTTFLTGYTQPCKQHGWTQVDSLPLDLTPGFQETFPLPGSLIYDDVLTYRYMTRKSQVGRVRLDYLERKILDTTQMKLFLLDWDGELIGKAGLLSEKSAQSNLHVNWYCGIRKGDIAFRLQDAHQYRRRPCPNPRLEIWHKEGAQNFPDGIGC